jgi:Ca-activated chloride channel family protein
VVAWALLGAVGGAQAVFRGGVDFILVDVSVRARGALVTALAATDFELFDGGVLQTIEEVSRETLPIDVVFVVDLSGSVEGPLLASLTRAIGAVRDQLRAGDRAGVLTFNHRLHEIDLMAAPGLGAALDLGTPMGQTSLLDATTMALIREPEAGRRRMAIVFTDGLDTTSFLDGPAMMDVARRAETAVFTVALTHGTARSHVPPPHEAMFAALAETTGGALAILQRNQDLSDSFVQAFDEFRRSYVIRYAYQGPARAGWHPLEVRIARRDQTYDVRARQGYFAQAPGSAPPVAGPADPR